MGGLLSGDLDLVITSLALEKARRLLPSLARASDEDARVALLSNVRSSLSLHAPIETVDHRDGEPQTIALLGVSTDPWGAALIKDCTVVTVLDRDGVRFVVGRGRARRAAVQPGLTPVAPLAGERHRFTVQGWPGVEALAVMADGSAVACSRRAVLTSPPVRPAPLAVAALPTERVVDEDIIQSTRWQKRNDVTGRRHNTAPADRRRP